MKGLLPSRVDTVDRIVGRARRRIVSPALGVVVMLGVIPGAAAASGWSTLARLTTSGPPDVALAVGAFAQPDGRFLLSGLFQLLQLAGGSGFHDGFGGRCVSIADATARGASRLAAGRTVAG
jgi:hypothetical protein